jgi:mono/diheme cytochrome c family protein
MTTPKRTHAAIVSKNNAGAQPRRSAHVFAKSATVVLVVLAPALSSAQTKNSTPVNKQNSVYVELAKAPRKAIQRSNPLQGDPDAVAGGAKLFDLHCAECHGEMADGGRKGPSLRADAVQRATPGTLFWLLTNGVVRRGMPVWSKLPEPQRWQIVSYIKSLAPAAKPPDDGARSPAAEKKDQESKPPGW